MHRHSHVHSQNCRCVYCPAAQRTYPQSSSARRFLATALRAYDRMVPSYLIAMLIGVIVSRITGIH